MAYDERIRDHYRNEALSHGTESTSTMADEFVRKKETEIILKSVSAYLSEQPKSHDSLLLKNSEIHIVDIGCGNGTTLTYLSAALEQLEPNYKVAYTGIEYTEEMHSVSYKRFANQPNIQILHEDVRRIDETICNLADIIILQRVLINLLDAEHQRMALDRIVGLLKPGGLLLAIEAFESNLDNLNAARTEFGLTKLDSADHNLYLPDNFFDHSLLNQWPHNYELINPNFFSTHYFVTRVLHASYLKSINGSFIRNSHFVNFFSNALPESIGCYSPIKIVLRERVLDINL